MEAARCIAVDLQARAVKHITRLSASLADVTERRDELEKKLQVWMGGGGGSTGGAVHAEVTGRKGGGTAVQVGQYMPR